ncbi:MAG: hypothetical protein Q3998_00520 [Porphyromonas sp.]|nr:hypothetical protein [Porphyromonas sp.]
MYKKHHILSILLLSFIALVTSCDPTIHEYPHPVKSHVFIRPHIDRTPPLLYKEVVYDEKWRRSVNLLEPLPAAPYLSNEGHSVRLILDIYKCSSLRTTASMRHEKLVERKVVELKNDAHSYQEDLRADLYDGNYCVLAWADYTRRGNLKNTYYNANTLLKILSIIPQYPSDIHLRDAATGQQSFTLDFNLGPEHYPVLPGIGLQSSRVIPVMLSRPMARYKIIASDYKAFIEDGGKLEGGTVKVVYKQYISVGYDVSTQEPNEFISTYTFSTDILQEKTNKEGEILLIGDYLFTSFDKEDTVIADFFFFDSNGLEINRCSNIEIPLKRNHETIVKALFLTKKIDNGGQVSIDENFEGEHVVEV